MCELATREYPWFQPLPKTFGSAKAAAEFMLGKRSETLIGVVVGADRAMSKGGKGKWAKSHPGVITICIGRTGSTEKVQAAFKADVARNASIDPDSFLAVSIETENVSSTLIRTYLKQIRGPQSQAEIAQQLVDKGYETLEVASYIVTHFDDLYIR